MHFVQAKGILSQNNGMNIYPDALTAASIATVAVSATDLHMLLKISK